MGTMDGLLERVRVFIERFEEIDRELSRNLSLDALPNDWNPLNVYVPE